MSNFLCEKVFLRGVLLHYYNKHIIYNTYSYYYISVLYIYYIYYLTYYNNEGELPAKTLLQAQSST